LTRKKSSRKSRHHRQDKRKAKRLAHKKGQKSKNQKRHPKKKDQKSGKKRSREEYSGVFSGNARGFGFVKVDPSSELIPDIFIPPSKVQSALSGDRVRIRILPERKKKRSSVKGALGPRGEVVRILERKNESLIGVYRNEPSPHVEIRLEGFPDVLVKPRDFVKNGDLVCVQIHKFPSRRGEVPQGTLMESLGESGDPKAEEKAIILKHNLSETFPLAVLNAVKGIPLKVSKNDIKGRKDLRALAFVTIDGEKARDFDDAVYIETTAQGGFRLYVAIADVSHYVLPGTPVDLEGYQRATSVYFPTRALHMIPESLSAGICSLLPNEDRLAMVAELLFDQNGQRESSKFYEGVIKSKGRLTYREVEHVLEGGRFAKGDPSLFPIFDSAVKSEIELRIGMLQKLQNLLFEQRKKRGSLDFDIPEAEIIFEGDELDYSVENIARGRRLSSHRLIEEFMIAANEAVAEKLTEAKKNFPYRIHDPPDELKIKDFFRVIQKIPEISPLIENENWKKPGVLAKILKRIQKLPQSRMINYLLLTSLKLAVYHTKNRGHFGLASRCYAHFTSPIRRYPDLLLHRALKGFLKHEITFLNKDTLQQFCDHCSKQEQIAVAAEREIVQFFKVCFMRERLGKEYPGQIVKITHWGFFVELLPFFVDGFVPLESLEEDDYGFDGEKQMLKGKRNSYTMGDAVQVRVDRADLEKRKITFSLVGVSS